MCIDGNTKFAYVLFQCHVLRMIRALLVDSDAILKEVRRLLNFMQSKTLYVEYCWCFGSFSVLLYIWASRRTGSGWYACYSNQMGTGDDIIACDVYKWRGGNFCWQSVSEYKRTCICNCWLRMGLQVFVWSWFLVVLWLVSGWCRWPFCWPLDILCFLLHGKTVTTVTPRILDRLIQG